MKKVTLLILFSLSLTCFAQNAKVDANGNYILIKKAPVISDTTKPTGKYAIDEKTGAKYKTYISKNGKVFYIRTAKTGNRYKVYIKL